MFAAGLALRRVDESDAGQTPPAPTDFSAAEHQATGAEAPAYMMRQVARFNGQLESFAELGIVLAVGVLLATVKFRSEVLWFIPVLFLVIRPLAVVIGLVGTPIKSSQRRLMGWFGIRGIGSLYYLLYAISHGIEPVLAERLLSITLAVVVASVVAHGFSVTPLMKRYEEGKPGP